MSATSTKIPALICEADDARGRKFWAVRGGTEGNYCYFLYRRNILSASENELTSTEKVVDVLAQEIMRLQPNE